MSKYKYKTKKELLALSPKEIIHYKKYLNTVLNDMLKDADEWKHNFNLVLTEMEEKLKDLKYECALSQVVREECDISQFDYLTRIH